jgi:hypothetical protein
MVAKEKMRRIIMNNLDFSPNQTHQYEEDVTSTPLRLLPLSYTQSSLLKEINEGLEKTNHPSISQPT